MPEKKLQMAGKKSQTVGKEPLEIEAFMRCSGYGHTLENDKGLQEKVERIVKLLPSRKRYTSGFAFSWAFSRIFSTSAFTTASSVVTLLAAMAC